MTTVSLFLSFFISLFIVLSLLHFLLTGNTPPISTPKKSVEKIIQYIKLKDSDTFYDLGCGTGKFLFTLSKACPKTKFIGIESSLTTYITALFLSIFKVRRNTNIKFGNFFKINLSPATHIFLWIYIKDLDKLILKLKKELKPGTFVYSMDFPFSGIQPSDKIDLCKGKTFGHTLYVYIF